MPSIIATHDEWNAWLMFDDGTSIDEQNSIEPSTLADIATYFASLQMESMPIANNLLSHGYDLRSDALLEAMPGIIEALESAVVMPDHGRLIKVSQSRVRRLLTIFRIAVDELRDLGIPNTLVHNDINLSNILLGETGCLFVDWAEAGVGNPFANFEQLRMQFAQDPRTASHCYRLTEAYQDAWSQILSVSKMSRALAVAPVFAISMYLHRQRSWLTPSRMNDPDLVRYARSMAGQMDRAARKLEEELALIA